MQLTRGPILIVTRPGTPEGLPVTVTDRSKLFAQVGTEMHATRLAFGHFHVANQILYDADNTALLSHEIELAHSMALLSHFRTPC